MTAIRAAVNQRVALGWESTAGTAAALAKEIAAFKEYTLGPEATTKQFTATGHRHPSASEQLTEKGKLQIKGNGCFNALGYAFGNLYGKATPAAHSPSLTAYDSIWTPKITGAQSPSTWTLGQGDASVGEQYTFGLLTGFSYDVARDAEMSFTLDGFTQSKTDAVPVMTGVTEVGNIPIAGKHMNIYLDTTSSGIGTTLIVNSEKFSVSASGYYDQFWALNRAFASFSNYVEAEPKFEVKLLVPADTAGKGILADLQSGQIVYVRADFQGPVLDSGNSIDYEFKHDMALFVSGVQPFSVNNKVFSVEYTFTLAEDPAWGTGQCQKITLTNGLQTY